ncbi:hypothetical protein [Marinobacter arenosus]|uniref:hypothetical protein n=1 Tax=Marinobacter arenosus TaxID=2856822 RepID=UPI001C4B7670|nr:hypothetical protein [Marinobacter arenosus]MBW0148037.1 hypothetical protein [Marinobacter arenosus]
MIRYTRHIGWIFTNLFLAAGLVFWPPALYAAILVTVAHCLVFVARYDGPSSFPLQVRFVYLALLIIGLMPYCQWINWIQLLGTTALITVDYCPLARLLSLASWNRDKPLSLELIRTTFLTPPVSGSFLKVV